MRPCYEWLSQGDVFVDVPIIRHGAANERGTALLITYGCALDKRTSKAGRPQITRVQFSPIRTLQSLQLDPYRITLLRTQAISPPEIVYLESVGGDGGEGAALLSEVYTLPAPFFDLEILDWSGHDGCDLEDPHHATARLNSARTVTMTLDERALLHKKMNVFWTGQWPIEDESDDRGET